MAKPPSRKSRPAPLLRDADPLVRGKKQTPRDPRQPQLPLDPMPERIEPCLALLASTPPAGTEWAFEVKWDGYRLAVHVEPQGVRILTRNGHDWTHRFPSIAAAAKEFGTTMILDGEAVVLDEQGRSDFGALQKALGGRGGRRRSGEAILYAFDLLYFDGHDLTRMSLDERRHLLEDLLDGAEGAIRLSQEIHADGEAFLATACEHDLEGIIAKHRDRPYRSGRTGDWLKIKCVQRESFVVVGYERSTSFIGGIASLLLAAWKGDGLVHVGSVGTGFTEKVSAELKTQLDAVRTDNPAVRVKGKNLVFCQPVLAAEVDFRAWTGDGKLRHTSFKGLRDAADQRDVYKIR